MTFLSGFKGFFSQLRITVRSCETLRLDTIGSHRFTIYSFCSAMEDHSSAMRLLEQRLEEVEAAAAQREAEELLGVAWAAR